MRASASILTVLAALLIGLLVSCPAEGDSGSVATTATDSAANAEPAAESTDGLLAQRGRNEQPGRRAAAGTAQHNPDNLPLHQIRLPAGFSISVYVADVPSARAMTLSPGGILYIGSRGAGSVYAAQDTDGDGFCETVETIASGYRMPVGVAWHDGDLYFSEITAVHRIADVDAKVGQGVAEAQRIAQFPDREHHGWKFIDIGPDNHLYVPVGVPCNVCDEGDPFGAILRFDLDGGNETVVARGMRNTVGFDWHPVTGELWWTDNGRDMLGDDIPPDELNRIPAGSGVERDAPHFGFPYLHGRDEWDPEYGERGRERGKDAYLLPEAELGPHVAALGMCFYTGAQFPEQYRDQIFIAEHGSWNRSSKIGYRVMLVELGDDNTSATSYEPFAEGWKQGESVWGRPVDVLVLPDGSMLVSDDYANCVYRISYEGA